ncbi:MAG TPA: sugar nucleotide-binding protein [Rickettsiales bacterium]|nr:sugar nucleotide-binding protein [Rickettsiales bacterium]
MFLIVGANGFLGNYFLKNILEKTDDNILATDINLQDNYQDKRINWVSCDITKIEDLQNINNLTKNEKDLKVIFLSAYHKPDLVLQNPKIAWNVNVIALANFLNIMDNIKVMYYPSTEVVYGEGIEGHKFNEEDKLNPINKYGEHKTIAERMVNVAGFNVVRFPVLMGASLIPNKKHFYDEIVETVKAGNTTEMFEDSFRSFIDFDTVAKVVLELINNPEAQKYKIVNIAGDEALSKYELGVRIAEKHNLDKSKIIPISMDKDKKIFTAKRSKETLLDNSLVKKILGLKELKIKI